MPKQERNKQFVDIEDRIRTNLLVRGLSDEKQQIHFDEFSEIKKLIEQEAATRQMCPAEFIRWLYLRWLSVRSAGRRPTLNHRINCMVLSLDVVKK
jgi:hypothetical protein